MRDWKQQQDGALAASMDKTINRGEWDQLEWVLEGGIVKVMGGRFRQVTEKEIVIAKDEWVTKYRHKGGWKEWEKVPFVTYDKIEGGEVDLEKIDMSHEENEYPKNSDSTVVKKVYWVLHDKTKALPLCVSEAVLCKINSMLMNRDELDEDSRAELIWEVASEIKPREGPVSEGFLRTLAAIDGTGELTMMDADVWSWTTAVKGTTGIPKWEEIGMQRDDGLSSSAVRVIWHKLEIQEALELTGNVTKKGMEMARQYYEWIVVPKGALSCMGGAEKYDRRPVRWGPMTMVYVAETEEATLKGKKVSGELWFMGGGEVWDDMVWSKIEEWPTEMSGLKWRDVVTREISGERKNEKNIVQQELEREPWD